MHFCLRLGSCQDSVRSCCNAAWLSAASLLQGHVLIEIALLFDETAPVLR